MLAMEAPEARARQGRKTDTKTAVAVPFSSVRPGGALEYAVSALRG